VVHLEKTQALNICNYNVSTYVTNHQTIKVVYILFENSVFQCVMIICILNYNTKEVVIRYQKQYDQSVCVCKENPKKKKKLIDDNKKNTYVRKKIEKKKQHSTTFSHLNSLL
jgi:hypothetical protein